MGRLYTWGLDYTAGTGEAGNRVQQLKVPHQTWPPAPATNSTQGESLHGHSVAASAVGDMRAVREVSGLGGDTRDTSYHSRDASYHSRISVGGGGGRALLAGSGGRGWCCAVSCGERHTLALIVPEEVGEAVGRRVEVEVESLRVVRARLLGGVMLSLRALRALNWSYEAPAREAGALARPVLREACIFKCRHGVALASNCCNIHACMHACMHTYMHAYIHACIHTYMQTHAHAHAHTHTQTRAHTHALQVTVLGCAE